VSSKIIISQHPAPGQSEGAGSRVAVDLSDSTDHGRIGSKCLTDAPAINCALRDRSSYATIRSTPDSTAVLTDIYPGRAVAAGSQEGNGTAISPAEQAYRSLELFDTVVTSLCHAGLSLHVAMDLPADAAREHIAAAVAYVDETIREVREAAFVACGHQTTRRK
jgi:hypothetical protein